MSTYFTYNDNPLKINIDDDTVKVYINDTDLDPILTFNNIKKTFVDNTILIHRNNNDYIFIGDKIFFFQALDEINKFSSRFDKNDISHSYAIDKSDNYYLLNKNVILNQNNILRQINPYTIY